MCKIRFSSPAMRWKEALPIGNGKTAVMVYGGAKRERLDFNDATLWSGYPRNCDNAAAKDALSEVRELLKDGKFERGLGDVSCRQIRRQGGGGSRLRGVCVPIAPAQFFRFPSAWLLSDRRQFGIRCRNKRNFGDVRRRHAHDASRVARSHSFGRDERACRGRGDARFRLERRTDSPVEGKQTRARKR